MSRTPPATSSMITPRDGLGRVARQHRLDRLPGLLALALVEDLEQPAARHRVPRHEQDGFDRRLHLRPVGHPPIASSSSTPSSRVVR